MDYTVESFLINKMKGDEGMADLDAATYAVKQGGSITAWHALMDEIDSAE